VRRRAEPLREARQALSDAGARAAEARGAAMSLDTAAEYALMLTTCESPATVPGQWELSAGEQELVTLVAQGRTDAQIAASCTLARPRSAPTWTVSGIRPAAAVAPT
jgi:DNA-binding NarL/FixJ family response regulator